MGAGKRGREPWGEGGVLDTGDGDEGMKDKRRGRRGGGVGLRWKEA